MKSMPTVHDHLAGVPLGESRRCDDMGPGGICTCCGQLKSCLQCGDPSDAPESDYCELHPSAPVQCHYVHEITRARCTESAHGDTELCWYHDPAEVQ